MSKIELKCFSIVKYLYMQNAKIIAQHKCYSTHKKCRIRKVAEYWEINIKQVTITI